MRRRNNRVERLSRRNGRRRAHQRPYSRLPCLWCLRVVHGAHGVSDQVVVLRRLAHEGGHALHELTLAAHELAARQHRVDNLRPQAHVLKPVSHDVPVGLAAHLDVRMPRLGLALDGLPYAHPAQIIRHAGRRAQLFADGLTRRVLHARYDALHARAGADLVVAVGFPPCKAAVLLHFRDRVLAYAARHAAEVLGVYQCARAKDRGRLLDHHAQLGHDRGALVVGYCLAYQIALIGSASHAVQIVHKALDVLRSNRADRAPDLLLHAAVVVGLAVLVAALVVVPFQQIVNRHRQPAVGRHVGHMSGKRLDRVAYGYRVARLVHHGLRPARVQERVVHDASVLLPRALVVAVASDRPVILLVKGLVEIHLHGHFVAPSGHVAAQIGLHAVNHLLLLRCQLAQHMVKLLLRHLIVVHVAQLAVLPGDADTAGEDVLPRLLALAQGIQLHELRPAHGHILRRRAARQRKCVLLPAPSADHLAPLALVLHAVYGEYFAGSVRRLAHALIGLALAGRQALGHVAAHIAQPLEKAHRVQLIHIEQRVQLAHQRNPAVLRSVGAFLLHLGDASVAQLIHALRPAQRPRLVDRVDAVVDDAHGVAQRVHFL